MKVDVARMNGVVILKPHGRITGDAVQLFKKAIYEELPRCGSPPKLVVDFADAANMDSRGLGTMMEAGFTIRQKGGQIGVINVSSHIRNLIVITHLVSHFKHFDSEDDAVLALSSKTQSDSTQIGNNA